MPTVEVQAPVVANNAGSVSYVYTDASTPVSGPAAAGLLYLGNTLKANQDQCVWVMFEPNIPAGVTFTAVEVGLWFVTRGSISSTDIPITAGPLALDGVWNNQSGNNGFGAYANRGLIPHPARTVQADVKWMGGTSAFFASISYLLPAIDGTFFQWNGAGGTMVSATMVAKAQAQFDGNQANRNARGVPMAFAFLPQTSLPSDELDFRGSVATTTAQRPYLRIDFNYPNPRTRAYELRRPPTAGTITTD